MALRACVCVYGKRLLQELSVLDIAIGFLDLCYYALDVEDSIPTLSFPFIDCAV
jgi:hypothetical protein